MHEMRLTMVVARRVMHAQGPRGCTQHIKRMLFRCCPRSSHVQMVTTRQQTSAPSRGRATSSRGRAHSRSTSRSVSRSTPQRSRASRGRGAQPGSTRGGRRRGASSRPDDGGGDLPAGVEELRRLVLEMRGNNLQLQREVADLRAQGEPGEAADPAGPADPADPAEMEERDEREEQEVIVANMPPPPAREPGTTAGTSRDVRLFLMKEDVRSWMNPPSGGLSPRRGRPPCR